MKVVAVLITMFMLFAGIKTLILVETEDVEVPDFKFPDFNIPFPQLDPITGDNALAKIASALGSFFKFFAQAFVWVLQQLLNVLLLVVTLILIIVFLLSIVFRPIESAPNIVNIAMMIFTIIMALYIVMILRGGQPE